MKSWFKSLFTTKRGIYNLISIIVLAALIVLGSIYFGGSLVRFAREPDEFKAFIEQYGAVSRFVFIGIQMLQVIFALIPGEFIELAAGYTFGWLEGTLLCLAGVLLATVPIFYLVRFLGKKLVFMFISGDDFKKLSFLRKEKNRDILFFLFYFIPGTPKDIFTYFAGFTKIKPMRFFIISTLGRLPSILSSAIVGSRASDEKYLSSIVIFGVTALVSAIGLLVYRKIAKHHKDKNASPDDEADSENIENPENNH